MRKPREVAAISWSPASLFLSDGISRDSCECQVRPRYCFNFLGVREVRRTMEAQRMLFVYLGYPLPKKGRSLQALQLLQGLRQLPGTAADYMTTGAGEFIQ